MLADVAAKALQQIRADILDLLDGRVPAERAAALAETLSQGRWTHDHPIGFRDAQALGLPVSSPMPRPFYDLMRLFPQPTQRHASVQYIPTPYGPPPARPETAK